MRCIRNTCASFMTGNQKQLSIREQSDWWLNLDHDAIHCWLFRENTVPVGYGLIRDDDSKSWLTAGFIPSARNHGLGRQAFEYLILMSRNEPWLRVLASNRRALTLYKHMGFTVIEQDKRVVTMRYGEMN